MLTGGLRTASRWLQEPSEPPKTPLREAKILKKHRKNHCVFALWFFALNGLLRLNMAPRWPKREPQDGPQRGPRRVQERSRAPQARPRRRPRGDFFFEGGMQNNIFTFFGQWSQDSPKTPPRPFSRASRGPKMAQKWPKMASRWPQVRHKNIEKNLGEIYIFVF